MIFNQNEAQPPVKKPSGTGSYPATGIYLSSPTSHYLDTSTHRDHPVGYVRSPYKTRDDAPRQGRLSGTISEIVIDEKYRPALWQIEGREHLWILCWFDRADRTISGQSHPGHRKRKGCLPSALLTARTRSRSAWSISSGYKTGVLKVRGLDAIDGTPVIDIKTYADGIDCARDD